MPVTEQGPVEGAPGAEGDENLLDDLESDKASASADEMETDSEDASEEGRLKRLVKNYKLRLTALDAKLKFQTSAAAIANRDYNEIVEQKQTLVATLNDYEDTIQQQATRIDELEHAAQELHGRIDLLSGEVAHRTQELEETREEVATYKEFTEKVQEAHTAKQEKLQQLRGRKRFRASGRGVSGGGQAGPSSGAGRSGQTGSSRQQQRYKARRSSAVTSYCIRKGLCINCYKPNKDPTTKAILHTGVNCPHPSAEGVPEGFTETA